MRHIYISFLLLVVGSAYSQPNCFIYPEGSGERKACELSAKAITYQQGSRESQLLFDSAIDASSKFAWAYYEKSVPYLKRGFLYEGLQILDEAVKLKPLEYLCYRAYWYWQYQNYELCIQDLEEYYSMPKAYTQTTPGGEKDMEIILGLAYAKAGDFSKGIEVILNCFNNYKSEEEIGFADYHSLGLLYVLNGQYDQGIEVLKKQILINPNLAATYYFLGLAYKGQSNISEAKNQFNEAFLKFEDVNRYHNTNAGFRIYPSDVENEIKGL